MKNKWLQRLRDCRGAPLRVLVALVALAWAGRALAVAETAPYRAFFEAHCLDCHDADSRKGELDLSTLREDFGDSRNFSTWAKIHDALAGGEMPPAKRTRPPEAELRAVREVLASKLSFADAARIREAGRIRLRRLTRSEYENSLKDVLALPRLEIQALLPSDGSVAGFRKNAGGLELSPSHLAAYAAAVEKALDLAIATRSAPPPVFKRRIYPAGLFKFGGNLQQGSFVLLKDQKPDPLLPLRGGFEEVKGYISKPDAEADMEERKRIFKENKVAASQSAVGLLMPNLAGYEAAMNVAPIYPGLYHLRVSLWGFHWNAGQVEAGPAQAAVLRAHEEGKQQEGGRLLGVFNAPSLRSDVGELRAWLDAHESIVLDPVSVPWLGLRVAQVGGRDLKHVGPGVALDWFEIEGPLNETWPPESHRRLFGTLPVLPVQPNAAQPAPARVQVRQIPGYLPAFHEHLSAADRNPVLESVHSERPEEDAARLLAGFLPLAFRRPVAASEVLPYVELVRKRLAAMDCFEDAMRRAYVAVLTSPEFLFLPAQVGRGSGAPEENVADAGAAARVSAEQYALASRLSYWLWNGPPDAQLLEKAGRGELGSAATLSQQIDRMLADGRSRRFVEDFADQWLELEKIDETTPDKKLYPEYSFLLHEGMLAETRAFVGELLEKDLPVSTLARSGFAMLTQRLAEHYGISGVEGVEVRRVELPGESARGGVLGQAAILKLTANGTTTSPVKRGVWVMDRFLNQPVPPPPKGVSLIDPDTRGATTIREQLDRHRSDSNCAACHAKIDPAGFAMESFDPVGGERTRYRSSGKGEVPPEKGRTPWRVEYRLGPAVDASGRLSDGRPFAGARDLQALLAADPERLAVAFLAHLSRYATGTEPSFSERDVLLRLARSTREGQYGLRSLLHALAQSPLFLGVSAAEPGRTP